MPHQYYNLSINQSQLNLYNFINTTFIGFIIPILPKMDLRVLFRRLIKLSVFIFYFVISLMITIMNKNDTSFWLFPAPSTIVWISFIGLLVNWTYPDPIYDETIMNYRRLNQHIYNFIYLAYGIITSVCVLYYSGTLSFFCAIVPIILSLIRIIIIIIRNNRNKEGKTLKFDIDNDPQIVIINAQDDESVDYEVIKQQKQALWKVRFARFFLVLGLLLVFAVTITAIATVININGYKPIGGLISLTYEDNNPKTVTFHIKCSDNVRNSTRPIFVFQHGAGSNLIAFLDIQGQLFTRGYSSCIYDRLGYGRSLPGPKNLNHEQKANLFNNALKRVIGQKKVIMVGWSAGVQISINYYYYFRERVQGLVFLDGYPDYLRLQAISQKQSSYTVDKTSNLLNFLSITEPFGFGFLVGDSKINNETIKNYYSAYYRTGYFWTSQINDFAAPYDLTEWLTGVSTADNATVPYPQSPIQLNWPDIHVPLLIMPASKTINDQSWGYIYQTQAEKYKQKCLNKSQIIPIEGQHDFILTEYVEVADRMVNFFFS